MNLRKVLGYVLLVLSLLGWAALPVFPFLSWDAATKAAWAGATFVFAEVTWWLAVLLLGKEIVQWFRMKWQLLKGSLSKKSKGIEAVADSEN